MTGRSGPDTTDGSPDDAHLRRLLSEGLGRQAVAPVDAHGLLAGAHRGAARIRRRRTAAVGVAAALVIGLPGSLLAGQLLARPADVMAESSPGVDAAGPAGSAAEVAAGPPQADGGAAERAGTSRQSISGAGDAASRGTSPPGSPTVPAASGPVAGSVAVPPTTGPASTAARLARTATGQVAVPDAAMLVVADLPRAPLRRNADTANRVVAPPLSAADVCGSPAELSGLPSAAGSRSVVFGPSGGTPSWLIDHSVRVFAGEGARQYVSVVGAVPCPVRPDVVAGDEAVAARSRPDAAGRAHWLVVVRVGRVVSEIRLTAPADQSALEGDVRRLALLAAERLRTSGLVAASASDPTLR